MGFLHCLISTSQDVLALEAISGELTCHFIMYLLYLHKTKSCLL